MQFKENAMNHSWKQLRLWILDYTWDKITCFHCT